MEVDSGSTDLHTSGSIVGGDRIIVSGGKGHEDEAKVCEIHGKHFKLVASSNF